MHGCNQKRLMRETRSRREAPDDEARRLAVGQVLEAGDVGGIDRQGRGVAQSPLTTSGRSTTAGKPARR